MPKAPPLHSISRAAHSSLAEVGTRKRAFDLSAVIVNYNSGEVLPHCLSSLKEACANLNLEIVVVDNGSRDGSLAWVTQQEGVRVVPLQRNVGFSRGNNIGASKARGAHYLFLNTDCFMFEGSLRVLMERLNSDRSIAVVGPRLLNADGTLQRTCHNFPSPLVFFLEQTMLWRLMVRLPYARERLQIASDHARTRDVDWLLGACLLVRGEALHQAGGFDEGFFFYWEEADLCRRLADLGWRVVFEPAGEAVHLGGASSQGSLLLVHFFRSLYRFYRKHYTGHQLTMTRSIVRLMAFFKAGRLYVKTHLPQDRDQAKALTAAMRAWLQIARL
jgi:GT2 family glycosyltransferase